jgi:hypothetical protein
MGGSGKRVRTHHITGYHPAFNAFPISVTAYTAPVLGYATNTP